MSVALSLILVVFFLFMNAFFVVAEFALVRVRKSQLQIAEEEGKSGAKAALLIANNVNAYLSACQLGITLASLALGWLGEPAVSELLHPLLEKFNPAAVGSVGDSDSCRLCAHNGAAHRCRRADPEVAGHILDRQICAYDCAPASMVL